MNKQLKTALLCGAAGYAISELLTVRRAYKRIRSAAEQSVERYRYKWAVQMVMKEVERGKYDNSTTRAEVKTRMDADLVYYREVAHILEIKEGT
jgi:hypothetical protein